MFNPSDTQPRVTRTFAEILGQAPVGNVIKADADNRLVTRRERIIEEARLQGYNAGFEQGRREGVEVGTAQAFAQTEEERQALITQQVDQFAQDLDQMGQDMRAAMQQWFVQAEQQLGRVAVMAAGRLLRKELDENPEVVIDIVRETIKEVTHAQEARIMVNPFDLKFLMGREDELNRLAPTIREVSIVGSDDVIAGCRIESDGGAIDARLEEGLRKLVAEVMGR
ncbi:MAG: hypothetical protein JNJ45_03615 [Chthonomonas sp.]|nr:hypothetical protein [Chthonomonas sp.]